MNAWQKALAAGVVLVLLWATWMFRYDMQVGDAGGERPPIAYVLDRWTGATQVLLPGSRRTLHEPPNLIDLDKP